MCGLLAGSGKLEVGPIVSLGVSNMERGVDSAGIAYLNSDGTYQLVKTIDHPAVAYPVTLYKDIEKAVASSIMIGHTRQATTGDVTEKNAHPFYEDGIVFAHNGIIFNHKDFGEYEVDSQCLIHGIKDRDFSKFEGCVALVWIEGNTLFAYASGNPLFRGTLNGGMYLASDKDYLERIKCTHIKALSTELVYEIRDGKVWDTKYAKGPKMYTIVYTPVSEFDRQAWDKWNKYESSEVSDVSKNSGYLYLNDEGLENMVDAKLCMNCDLEDRWYGLDYCYTCANRYGLISEKGERK